MKRLAITLVSVVVVAVVAVVALALAIAGTLFTMRWRFDSDRAAQLEHLVAASWGGGRYGPAFYGAYVYYEPQPDGQLAVMLRVSIGRSRDGMGYEHDARLLGTAATSEEAVARWGVIEWSEAGITVGSGADAFLFPRGELERHR